jgi:hypothetical protein
MTVDLSGHGYTFGVVIVKTRSDLIKTRVNSISEFRNIICDGRLSVFQNDYLFPCYAA